ncbi:MAG: glycoside hydrolase family 43 protein [Acidimicrobiia bacterium]
MRSPAAVRSRRVWLAIAITSVAVVASACLPPPPDGAPTDPVLVNVGRTGNRPIDFPDPSIMKTGDTFYGYSTGGPGGTVQVIKSTDLVHWSWVGDAFVGPTVYAAAQTGSTWAILRSSTWAPSVIERPANDPSQRFVLYYSAKSVLPGSAGMWCIGRATSAKPEGPFVDERNTPILCQPERGGSIDPKVMVADDGQVYLVSQSFGIAATGEPTRIWSTLLTNDGLSVALWPFEILASQWDTFETPVIESPTMMPAPGGGYLLFYSAGQWWLDNYKVAVAWCATPLAPCERIYSGPLLTSRGAMAGPGGEDVFQDASGNWWMVFHAWAAPYVGYVFGDTRYARMMRLLPITFPDGTHNPKVG